MSDSTNGERYVSDPSERQLTKKVLITASSEEVWEAWTTEKGLSTFLTSSSKVELRFGGPYEIYFLLNAPLGSRGSEGCRVLSFLPFEMLSFEWNAPPHFGKLRPVKTQVVILMGSVSERETEVSLSHIGWGKGEDWDDLYGYFDKAWEKVLDNLKRRFGEGPLEPSELLNH